MPLFNLYPICINCIFVRGGSLRGCHKWTAVQTELPLRLLGCSLAKWLPTARFIRGSSVLFTLFNCLTVPVYAVSLPILPAFIKTAEPAFNKSAAFQPTVAAATPPDPITPDAAMRLPSGVTLWSRGLSTLGAVCAWEERRCLLIPAFLPCVNEFPPPPPCSQVVSPKHLKVGGLTEPFKPVVNKPGGGEPAWAANLDRSSKKP